MKQRAYFPVARGLICSEHRQQIGSSAWVFLWVLSKQSDNTGAVARREVITAAQIGADIGMDERNVRNHLDRLENTGYVTIEKLNGNGLRLWVNKPLIVAKADVATPGEVARGDQKPTGLPRASSPGVEPLPRASSPGPFIEGTEVEAEQKKQPGAAGPTSTPDGKLTPQERAEFQRDVENLPPALRGIFTRVLERTKEAS